MIRQHERHVWQQKALPRCQWPLGRGGTRLPPAEDSAWYSLHYLSFCLDLQRISCTPRRHFHLRIAAIFIPEARSVASMAHIMSQACASSASCRHQWAQERPVSNTSTRAAHITYHSGVRRPFCSYRRLLRKVAAAAVLDSPSRGGTGESPWS